MNTTTMTMQTSHGRPGRAFLANFLGGPLVVSALVAVPPAAYMVIRGCMERLPWNEVLFLAGSWPFFTVVQFLTSILVGIATATYATIEIKNRGTYSVPIAIAIAISVAFIVKAGTLTSVLGMGTIDISDLRALLSAMLFAASCAALAGWLARRSGAAWRFS